MIGRFLQAGVAVAATLLLFASPAAAQFDGADDIPDELKQGFDSITADQAEEWLSLLAGPKFEGRGTGQTGYAKAAHWIAGKVAEFGLEPAGEGGTYFQMLPVTRRSADPQESKLTGPNGLEIVAEGNLSFDNVSDIPEVAGQVVFLRLKDGQLGEDIDIRDKFVIYTGTAQAGRRGGNPLIRQGASALLQVTDETPQSTPQIILPNRGGGRGGRGRGGGGQGGGLNVRGQISKAAAMQVLEAVGGKEEWLDLDAVAETTVNEADATLAVTVRIREEPEAVPNVVAWLPGSDPDLQHEYIVLGAHLDHLGLSRGEIHPGADDNGSGSTCILSVARALATNPVKPKRSVLFIWFAAEERGLVGSRYFVSNPTVSLDDALCMLNTDMVGRNEETDSETAEENEQTIHLIGSQRGDIELHETILEANKYLNFEFEYDQESVFNRSDQAAFISEGMAVAFLFGGFHPDYHRPTDTPDKINYDKIKNAGRLFYVTIHLAAEHGKYKRTNAESPGSQ